MHFWKRNRELELGEAKAPGLCCGWTSGAASSGTAASEWHEKRLQKLLEGVTVPLAAQCHSDPMAGDRQGFSSKARFAGVCSFLCQRHNLFPWWFGHSWHTSCSCSVQDSTDAV